MAEKVNPIPEGYRTITPCLVVKGASETLATHVEDVSPEEMKKRIAAMGLGG